MHSVRNAKRERLKRSRLAGSCSLAALIFWGNAGPAVLTISSRIQQPGPFPRPPTYWLAGYGSASRAWMAASVSW